MATVTFDKATRIYPGNDKPSVDQLDLKIEDGEFLVLVSPSGCGKSTSPACSPASRTSTPAASSSATAGRHGRPPKNRDIAMVFQNYALLPAHDGPREHGLRLKIAGTPKGRDQPPR